MSVERDPRNDPRPGDVLQNVFSGITRTVTAVRDGPGPASVDFTSDRKGDVSGSMLRGWRRWASGAEVVRRGEEASHGRR